MTNKSAHPISIDAFCQRYGIGKTLVYKEINTGRLKRKKIGIRAIITEQAEKEWLELAN